MSSLMFLRALLVDVISTIEKASPSPRTQRPLQVRTASGKFPSGRTEVRDREL